MLLAEITMNEFQEHLQRTRTVLIPFGSIEEHGTHLPLNTDALIVEEVLKEVAKRQPVFLIPTLYYGVCTSTRNHGGTISIKPETLRRLTKDIVEELYKKGLMNFFLISGHAGGIHMSAMREAAEELVEVLENVKIAVFSLYDFMWQELAQLADTPNDSHAGEIETSLVMAIALDLVKGTSPEEYPSFPKPFIVKDKVKYWQGGVWGNPSKASVNKGQEVFRRIVDKVSEIVGSI